MARAKYNSGTNLFIASGANYYFSSSVGGFVGIGTATPTAQFDVFGGNIKISSPTGILDVSTASTNGVRFFNRGGAGISTTTQSWYEEGSYTPVLSAGWTVTAGNYTGFWQRCGDMVTVWINFFGGTTSGATGGQTVSTPVGLTPLRLGSGPAVNANGTVLGNGLVVATTAGTIINSSAITNSTVDKVLQVSYIV